MKNVSTLTRAIKAGAGRIGLGGRIGAKRLSPGGYRLTLTARDAAGNRSGATRRAFKVLSN
jgi:hypothetical protein